MSHGEKTREELIEDVAALQKRVVELEAANRRLELTELELATSEKRLQSIMDSTTAVIYVKDLSGSYFTVNRQFEELFHVSREDIVGKTDYQIFPRDLADAFRKNDGRVVEAKKPIEFEEVAPHDDGPHTYLSIKFPLWDSLGNLYAVCGISTDITDRKRGEDAMRQAIDGNPELKRRHSQEVAKRRLSGEH